jgi:hypothetical protein
LAGKVVRVMNTSQGDDEQISVLSLQSVVAGFCSLVDCVNADPDPHHYGEPSHLLPLALRYL